ncbi:MAG: hypothetical protein M3Q57_04400 [Pseudomonadota bacterium]|nr:hypothetical protein [Pseudomonadota bacterium]
MVKWLGELLSFLASLGGLAGPVFGPESDKASDQKRKRILDAFYAKHGSKRDKK